MTTALLTYVVYALTGWGSTKRILCYRRCAWRTDNSCCSCKWRGHWILMELCCRIMLHRHYLEKNHKSTIYHYDLFFINLFPNILFKHHIDSQSFLFTFKVLKKCSKFKKKKSIWANQKLLSLHVMMPLNLQYGSLWHQWPMMVVIQTMYQNLQTMMAKVVRHDSCYNNKISVSFVLIILLVLWSCMYKQSTLTGL